MEERSQGYVYDLPSECLPMCYAAVLAILARCDSNGLDTYRILSVESDILPFYSAMPLLIGSAHKSVGPLANRLAELTN